jgi:cell wall-associated NlpC family hydrolase
MFHMKIVPQFFLLAVSISLIAGCASPTLPRGESLQEGNKPSHLTPLSDREIKTKSAFVSVYNRWEGVPYRLGGTTYQGIDCSAFIQTAYKEALNVSLPRTTKQQSKLGSEINYDDAVVGDLVFFRTSRTTRHVGIYLGKRQFLHASTSKGVIISRVDNPYWASTFWHFRRVI